MPLIFALDPARFGADKTCLAIGTPDRVHELVTWAKKSTMETCGLVMLAMEERGLDPTTTEIRVDAPGLGGPVADRLQELGCAVTEFNGGSTPHDPVKFQNRRAESYWTVRRKLEEGELAFPADDHLTDELCSTNWRPNSRGKIELEAKDQIRARLGRSPDRADAVAMLCLAAERPRVCTIGHYTF